MATDRPIRLVVRDDLRRRRLTVLLRLILALPHLFWLAIWSLAVVPVAFVAWLAVLFERRVPGVLHEFLATYLRYATQLTAYLHLAADPYPGFTGRPGYPVEVEIDPPRDQGRAGAAFRLVLAVPAFLVSSSLAGSLGGGSSTGGWVLSGGLAATAAFLGWFACLARGRMPRGLRDAVVYAIGYGAWTTGYALLLTDRYPSADPSLVHPSADLPPHPVRAAVTDPLERSRLVVAFRALLVLPHAAWLALWSLLVPFAALAAWAAALAVGRVPSPLHRFLAAYTRYGAHVGAFLFVVGGPFPGFVGAAGSYPVDVEIDGPARQRRRTVVLRLLLALPALLLSGAYGTVLLAVGVLGWWAALATGRMPGGLRDLGVASVRYSSQATAYALLVTERYPDASPALRPPAEAAV